MPSKRRRSEDKVHADREDELHDATGKTVRLTKETRTARDTDNPDRESIVGKDPKSKKHRRSKTPVELTSSVKTTPKLPKVAPATDVADAAEIKSNKAERKRLRRKAKAVERAEKKKSHQSSDVPHTVDSIPSNSYYREKGNIGSATYCYKGWCCDYSIQDGR